MSTRRSPRNKAKKPISRLLRCGRRWLPVLPPFFLCGSSIFTLPSRPLSFFPSLLPLFWLASPTEATKKMASFAPPAHLLTPQARCYRCPPLVHPLLPHHLVTTPPRRSRLRSCRRMPISKCRWRCSASEQQQQHRTRRRSERGRGGGDAILVGGPPVDPVGFLAKMGISNKAFAQFLRER